MVFSLYPFFLLLFGWRCISWKPSRISWCSRWIWTMVWSIWPRLGCVPCGAFSFPVPLWECLVVWHGPGMWRGNDAAIRFLRCIASMSLCLTSLRDEDVYWVVCILFGLGTEQNCWNPVNDICEVFPSRGCEWIYGVQDSIIGGGFVHDLWRFLFNFRSEVLQC